MFVRRYREGLTFCPEPAAGRASDLRVTEIILGSGQVARVGWLRCPHQTGRAATSACVYRGWFGPMRLSGGLTSLRVLVDLIVRWMITDVLPVTPGRGGARENIVT